MGKSERTPQDLPLEAAIDFLLTGEPPKDPKLGTVIEKRTFVLEPRQNVQTSVVAHISPVRRLLRTTGLT